MARAKKKEKKEETEKLIPSLLPTSTTDEVDVEEEVAEQAEPAKFQILKYLGPVLLGLFTFIFGLIFFFPVNDFAWEGVRYVQAQNVPLEVEDINLSLLGSVKIKKPSIIVDPAKGSKLTMSNITGDFSTWGLLLGGDLDADLDLSSIKFSQPPFELNRGDATVSLQINNIRKAEAKWQGRVIIKGRSIQARYNEALPFVGENLELMINKLTLTGGLSSRVIRLQPVNNIIESNLARIQFQGSIIVSGRSPNLNVKAIITPLGQLKKTINENRIMLEGSNNPFGYLLDNPIQIQLTGPLNRINFRPIKQASSSRPANNVPNPQNLRRK